MYNLDQMGEALPELPEQDFHTKFPIELRQKIFQEYKISQNAIKSSYRNRIEETEREIQRRREQIDNAQFELLDVPEDEYIRTEVYQFRDDDVNQLDQETDSETEDAYLNPIERTIVEAEDAIFQATKDAAEYARMMRLIELQIDNRARLLRMRNEPPF